MIFSRLKSLVEGGYLKTAFIALVGLLLIFFFIQMYGKAYRTNGYDFTSYVLSAKALLQSENPYKTGSSYPFVYPLFPCVYLIPFVFIPYWVANAFWFILNVFAVVYSVRKLHGTLVLNSALKDALFLECVLFVVMLNVVQNNLLNGQINFLVLSCTILFFIAVTENTILKAALLLAAAVSTKLTPAIFFLYLLVTRKFKILALSVAFTAVFAVVLPYIIAGDAVFEYYHFYLNEILLKKTSWEGIAENSFTFSLQEVLRILFQWNNVVIHALSAVLITVPLIIARTFREHKVDRQTIMFSLYIVAMLLLSPISETHHLIYLIVPFMVIFEVLNLYTNSSSSGIFFLLSMFIFLIIGKYTPFIYFSVVSLCFFSLFALGISKINYYAPIKQA